MLHPHAGKATEYVIISMIEGTMDNIPGMRDWDGNDEYSGLAMTMQAKMHERSVWVRLARKRLGGETKLAGVVRV